MIDFLESLPKDYQNKDLIERVKENLARQIDQQQQMAQQEAQMGAQQEQMQGEEQDAQMQQQEAQFEKMAQWLEQQDPELQQKIMALPEGEKEQTIMKLMQEDVQSSMKQQREGMI
jgi:vacuolar-type H+-ATPase subunit E/Vma4